MVQESSKEKSQSQDATSSAGEKRQDGRDTAHWIAEVSHELRLPIANVSLLVETLLNGGMEDPQVARRMLERAKQEVERLQSLVGDLLSVENLSQTRDEIQREWVKLEDRIGYALESTKRIAASGQVNVQVEVAPNLHIYANGPQLDQVLLNLLENAIKFTPPDGQVTIKSGKANCFSVTDTGIGMSEAEIPKIFARFYRIDRSRGRGSTGLGLSIVKHIVDLHDAKINVTSKEGVGSTFELEFPGPSIGNL